MDDGGQYAQVASTCLWPRGKLWVFGGGNPFAGSSTMPTSGKTGGTWLKRLFSPETTNSLQVYDPATNSWTNGPTLNQQRSFLLERVWATQR